MSVGLCQRTGVPVGTSFFFFDFAKPVSIRARLSSSTKRSSFFVLFMLSPVGQCRFRFEDRNLAIRRGRSGEAVNYSPNARERSAREQFQSMPGRAMKYVWL